MAPDGKSIEQYLPDDSSPPHSLRERVDAGLPRCKLLPVEVELVLQLANAFPGRLHLTLQ